MQIESFTGGIFDTNCFFLPESGILRSSTFAENVRVLSRYIRSAER